MEKATPTEFGYNLGVSFSTSWHRREEKGALQQKCLDQNTWFVSKMLKTRHQAINCLLLVKETDRKLGHEPKNDHRPLQAVAR